MKKHTISPAVSCIHCRKLTSFKGLSGHYFSKHDAVGIKTMADIRAKGTAASFGDAIFQKKIHTPKKIQLTRQCANPACNNTATGKFCSRSCSAIVSNAARSAESRAKQADTLLRNKRKTGWLPKTKTKIRNERQIKTRICSVCSQQDITTGRFQSDKCKFCNDSLTYRNSCKFTFNLKDYPDEFNLSLLVSPGMFHPVSNQAGVSRDHLVSVHHGKENKIDPTILSHPANCALVTQSQNKAKQHFSSMTVNELLTKIARWDLKYKTY